MNYLNVILTKIYNDNEAAGRQLAIRLEQAISSIYALCGFHPPVPFSEYCFPS